MGKNLDRFFLPHSGMRWLVRQISLMRCPELFVVPVAFAFSRTLTGILIPKVFVPFFSWLAGEDQVSMLECVEFRRAWFYAEFLGDDSPSLSPTAFIGIKNGLKRFTGHKAKLKQHESISRGIYHLDNGFDPRQRDTKLTA